MSIKAHGSHVTSFQLLTPIMALCLRRLSYQRPCPRPCQMSLAVPAARSESAADQVCISCRSGLYQMQIRSVPAADQVCTNCKGPSIVTSPSEATTPAKEATTPPSEATTPPSEATKPASKAKTPSKEATFHSNIVIWMFIRSLHLEIVSPSKNITTTRLASCYCVSSSMFLVSSFLDFNFFLSCKT